MLCDNFFLNFRLSLESAYTHRDKLYSEWETLPSSLYERLLQKMQSMENICEDTEDGDKAKTCTIS